MPESIVQSKGPGARWRRALRIGFLGILIAWLAMAVFHSLKPLPEGISATMPMRPAVDVEFLADHTWVNTTGAREVEQQIFDRVLALARAAEQLIVLDMFLFNDFAGEANGDDMRRLSHEVEQALLDRRRSSPGVRIVLITDPINHLYGGLHAQRLERLRRAGVEVVVTRLSRLRDSNPAWSGLWRLCCQWAGNSPDGGWLPNPIGRGQVSLRTWLRLVNFKANHRKTVVADTAGGWVALVTSGNPHDASSAHGNVAVEFSGAAALDLLSTESAVVTFSSNPSAEFPEPPTAGAGPTGNAMLQVLTEGAIRDAAVRAIAQTGPGDNVDLAIFYLSHRGIINALKDAAGRGASVRVLLDPNRDAFGKQKDGIPNRPVARELVDSGIPVRWCNTQGEQCHSKFLMVAHADGETELIAGSANFTRRNLDNLNLETSVRVTGPADLPALASAAAYFEQRWTNTTERTYSLPYSAFAEHSTLRYWRYRLMEFSGLSTF